MRQSILLPGFRQRAVMHEKLDIIKRHSARIETLISRYRKPDFGGPSVYPPATRWQAAKDSHHFAFQGDGIRCIAGGGDCLAHFRSLSAHMRKVQFFNLRIRSPIIKTGQITRFHC